MKKLLFLLFGVIFTLAGCADSSTGNNGDTTVKCSTISTDDFKYYNNSNKYYTVLMDAEKSICRENINWKQGEETHYGYMLPVYYANAVDTDIYATLYYNGNQVGNALNFTSQENSYTSSNIPNNCPISTDDYSFSKIQDSVSGAEFNASLINEDKKIYEDKIKWITSEGVEYKAITPNILFTDRMSSEETLTVTLFYDSQQCGKPFVLNMIK